MEKNNILWYSMSDRAIISVLGDFIQKTRLQKNKTQNEIATAAGVNRSTIVKIENGGGGTLLSFIQILRSLEQLHLLQNFEVKQQMSPLELAKLEQKERLRASKKPTQQKNKPKSSW